MALTVTGVVTSNPSGNTLTFTDTTTGVGTLVSRTLNIYNANGVLLTTINMGATLSTTYSITADQYLSFVETIIDNTGTYTGTVNIVSDGFYWVANLNMLVLFNPNFCNITISLAFLAAAQRYGLAGNGIAAQANIILANYYVNQQR